MLTSASYERIGKAVSTAIRQRMDGGKPPRKQLDLYGDIIGALLEVMEEQTALHERVMSVCLKAENT